MKNIAPSPAPAQNAAVASAYSGDILPFSSMEMHPDNTEDAMQWFEKDEMVALVDESQGGIIGYVHRAHADRIAALLNVAALVSSGVSF